MVRKNIFEDKVWDRVIIDTSSKYNIIDANSWNINFICINVNINDNSNNVNINLDINSLLILNFLLEGPAKQWHLSLSEDIKSDWNSLKQAFYSRFQPSGQFDLSVLAINQQPAESVSDYISRVEQATSRKSIPTDILVAIAVNGLNPSVRQWVYNKEPKTLEQVRHQGELAAKSYLSVQQPDQASLTDQVTKLSALVMSLMENQPRPVAAAMSTQQETLQDDCQQGVRYQSQPRRDVYSSRQERLQSSYPGQQSEHRPRDFRREHHRPSSRDSRERCSGCGGYCSQRNYCPHRHTICNFAGRRVIIHLFAIRFFCLRYITHRDACLIPRIHLESGTHVNCPNHQTPLSIVVNLLPQSHPILVNMKYLL
ncbi:uncharacterized protein LOC124252809 [Haliotis rubra]|uniref:uncharacterized protein LOC124252809 n=1 Tax=Haliotis rubra TaxID=36100 RepID=UPI001EE5AAC3|nr:uncharacterized protein LOC124252809 [Haliotis rubra]